MDSKMMLDLFNRLKIDANQLDSLESNQVKTELSSYIEDHFQHYSFLQQTLDLGYQEMQKMHDLIEQRESLTKLIFDSSQDIILILDSNGQIIEFNHTSEILLKVNGSAIMGKKLSAVIPLSPFTADLFKVFEESSSLHFDMISKTSYESIILDSQGVPLEVLISFNCIQNHGNIIYPLYIKNITPEKSTARLLNENRSQMLLTSKMSALGEMAGGLAHEINTPLAVIQMKTDQLLESITDGSVDLENLKLALNTIDKTVRRIAKIVTGLRSFARDGRKDPLTPCSVPQVIEDTFSLCREKFNSFGVRLNCDSTDDIKFECRPTEITQVLLNILNNAFDAIKDLPEKWVKIDFETIGESVVLRITDSGLGIPSNVQEKMMQPFFTTKEIGKGTGLGLSISKGIIESHGGSLAIDNLSAHTCLVICMPLRRKSENFRAA